MLETDTRLLPIIAEQKTEHSWLLPVMEAAKDWDMEQEEQAEELMDRWIRETAETLHPESRMAARVVRLTLLYLLENKAITRVKEAHPNWGQWLPEVLNPTDAVRLAQMEVGLSEEDVEAAMDLLGQMQDGNLQPSKEQLSAIAQEQR